MRQGINKTLDKNNFFYEGILRAAAQQYGQSHCQMSNLPIKAVVFGEFTLLVVIYNTVVIHNTVDCVKIILTQYSPWILLQSY